jgi:Ca2+-binding EF-hand superfamily protein
VDRRFGVTTRSDAETVADSTFTMADANADGVIDRTEFLTIAAPVEAADEIFAAAAAGKNEATVESLREALLQRFDEADSNGDETLDQTERQAFQRLALGE